MEFVKKLEEDYEHVKQHYLNQGSESILCSSCEIYLKQEINRYLLEHVGELNRVPVLTERMMKDQNMIETVYGFIVEKQLTGSIERVMEVWIAIQMMEIRNEYSR